MKTKDKKNAAKKVHQEKESQEEKGSSKGKASFDQNGAGASDKFGQAGSSPNESGESGPGTINKNEKA
ncbi:hypothetical protein [uncultured Pedobacter sp.]|uniref:hypothetical protein n=1 Tax=uncultured Pedobacter sp. TaxID=246139 RepID=UPI0025DD8FED|nr:hypothetical protein [uncultured Pedobacter sp.]